mmetsp:Transcript_14309/g.18038  ORF Transcript_14309/g.18038 Transcript_14309/m.18038 type:complete len:129 (+) Transcript_14309:3-389(+)
MKAQITELDIVTSIFEPIKPLFSYAKELRAVAPLVSYLCAYHGLQKGISLFRAKKEKLSAEKQSAIQKVLMQKLPEVERQKAEEAVVKDLPNKSKVLQEFLQVVFITCVVRETELHQEFQTLKQKRQS